MLLCACTMAEIKCPLFLDPTAPPPDGFKGYPFNSRVFHGGYRGIVEDRVPSPANPCQECFYDSQGFLIPPGGPGAGTPDDYDGSKDPIAHAVLDRGGILRAGFRSLLFSLFRIGKA